MGKEFFFGAAKMFCNLIGIMVVNVLNLKCILFFKMVNLMLCEFYFDKKI